MKKIFFKRVIAYGIDAFFVAMIVECVRRCLKSIFLLEIMLWGFAIIVVLLLCRDVVFGNASVGKKY
jgi:hypothetical protein